MKLRITLLIGLALGLIGCQEQTTIAGYPEKGMTQDELVQAANKQLSTRVIGHLEVGPNKHRVPLRWVGMWTDETAQSEEEFAIGLGRVMRAMSMAADVEFCAQICRNKNTWGAAILTIDSGRYCPYTGFCPSERWQASGVSIHSHRRSGAYVMTPQDQALRTGQLRPAMEIALEAERASKLDLEQRGWIVGTDGLWLVDAQGQLHGVWDYGRERAGPPARAGSSPTAQSRSNAGVGQE